jgi:hypothetical protein
MDESTADRVSSPGFEYWSDLRLRLGVTRCTRILGHEEVTQEVIL